MSEKWEVTEPRVLDIGDEGERVRQLTVGLVGGRVDVVTHDAPTARLEIEEVVGRPLRISWDGRKLKILQINESGESLWSTIKNFTGNRGADQARISVAVPRETKTSVSTVSASSLVSGLRAELKANTVSGGVTVDDIEGDTSLNTVSGSVEAHALTGSLRTNAVSGEVTVHSSRIDPIKLNTVSGDITLDLLSGHADVKSNSVSGDVTIRIPADDGYAMTVHSTTGHAIADGVEMSGKQGRKGGRLTDGDEALTLTANSVSGDVVVLRAGGLDLSKEA